MVLLELQILVVAVVAHGMELMDRVVQELLF